jgi:heme/copper-type cytochrome/quinol oxidase subunit 2
MYITYVYVIYIYVYVIYICIYIYIHTRLREGRVTQGEQVGHGAGQFVTSHGTGSPFVTFNLHLTMDILIIGIMDGIDKP